MFLICLDGDIMQLFIDWLITFVYSLRDLWNMLITPISSSIDIFGIKIDLGFSVSPIAIIGVGFILTLLIFKLAKLLPFA